jgi:glutathione S-transferase
MIAESVRDLLSLLLSAPFQRIISTEANDAHVKAMKEKWSFVAARYEAILETNQQDEKASPHGYLVGDALTYADVLVAHVTTWFVEECGADIVENMPLLVELQNTVISLPGVESFIKSKLFFPVGDEAYVVQVFRFLFFCLLFNIILKKRKKR